MDKRATKIVVPILFILVGIITLVLAIIITSTNNTTPQNDQTPNNTIPITLCKNTGGTWKECGSGCGPLTKQQEEENNNRTIEPRICPAVCIPQCECPQEKKYWDETKGCTP